MARPRNFGKRLVNAENNFWRSNMGLFDMMFGSKAEAAAAAPNAEARFNELKGKYSTVLGVIEQQGIQLHNLHVEDNKLYIKGSAPSDDAKNAAFDQLKLVDASFSDIIMDLDVAQQAHASYEEYTVQSGDTLSKIARNAYGSSGEYMKIFYANQDQLSSPDRINVGQVLKIPR
jgi:nucleoid-associated protein YgaU